MTGPTTKPRTSTDPSVQLHGVSASGSPSLLYRVRSLWGGEGALRVTTALVLAACALLSLNAAATVEVVYTLRLSYILLAVACVAGLPFVRRGWRSLPASWRWTAGLVVASYTAAAVVGSGGTLAEQERGGSQREILYLMDLLLGLATVCLLAGLFSEGRKVRLPLGALVLGALGAAIYGIVQWPAQHFDWPLASINNALNPDAVTRGDVFQGNGLVLGWERVRGTFTEPLFFGLYLGTMLPLITVWLTWRRRRLIACAVVASVIAFALLLTSSFPSWALFALASVVGLISLSISRGAVIPAALAGGTLAIVGVGVGFVLFGNPEIFAKATGRDASEFAVTSSARTTAWEQSARAGMRRPVLGHGPGQSAVQLAYRQDPKVVGKRSAPVVLGSAQGLLPAALIDAGLLGVSAWIAFVVASLLPILRGLSHSPTNLQLGIAVACLIAAGGALVSGDRFEIQVWVVLGLALATTTGYPRARESVKGS